MSNLSLLNSFRATYFREWVRHSSCPSLKVKYFTLQYICADDVSMALVVVRHVLPHQTPVLGHAESMLNIPCIELIVFYSLTFVPVPVWAAKDLAPIMHLTFHGLRVNQFLSLPVLWGHRDSDALFRDTILMWHSQRMRDCNE